MVFNLHSLFRCNNSRFLHSIAARNVKICGGGGEEYEPRLWEWFLQRQTLWFLFVDTEEVGNH